MQPTHATSDMRWAEDRVGRDRLAGCYAWARLRDAGARLAFGSDFPVESENPLWGIYSAVTRQDHEGEPAGGWRPDQRLTPEEALRAFTRDAAFAAFRETDLGSLEAGKLADLVVLSDDVLAVQEHEVRYGAAAKNARPQLGLIVAGQHAVGALLNEEPPHRGDARRSPLPDAVGPAEATQPAGRIRVGDPGGNNISMTLPATSRGSPSDGATCIRKPGAALTSTIAPPISL